MTKQEWWEKKFRRVNRRRKRLKGRNLHHLTPQSRGGKNTKGNLLLIHIERHEAWHKMFGNRTAEEVLALLERVVRAKQGQDRGYGYFDRSRRRVA